MAAGEQLSSKLQCRHVACLRFIANSIDHARWLESLTSCLPPYNSARQRCGQGRPQVTVVHSAHPPPLWHTGSAYPGIIRAEVWPIFNVWMYWHFCDEYTGKSGYCCCCRSSSSSVGYGYRRRDIPHLDCSEKGVGL